MGFLSRKDVPQPPPASSHPLHPLEIDGMRKLSEYQIVRHLGKGACAEVKEVIHTPTGASYALKIIAKSKIPGFNSEASRGKVLREMTLLGPGIFYSSPSHASSLPDSDAASVITSLSGRQVTCNGPTLSHPSIVTVFDTFQTQTHFYIVVELAHGGTFFGTFVTVAGGQATRRHFKEPEAARLLFRVVSGISFLHDHDIVHRDLKPDNIMFRQAPPTDAKLARKWIDEDVMIMDFGVAQHCAGNSTISSSSIIGTPRYAAPEILCLSGHGKPADMWSIGCLTYASLCGYNPFYAASDLDHLKKLTTASPFVLPTFPSGTEPSALAIDFIRRCLEPDPTKRLTARDALKHPWLAAHVSESALRAEMLIDEDDSVMPDANDDPTLDATPTLTDSHGDSSSTQSASRSQSPRLSFTNDSEMDHDCGDNDQDIETGTTPRGIRVRGLPFELFDRQAMRNATQAATGDDQPQKKDSGVLAFWKVAVGATPAQQVSALSRTVSSS